MTKNNKILIGILAFMLVCVVGYALFSDNITVTGTATAQGQFMIVPSCEVITTDTITLSARQKVSGYKSTGTGTCTIENGVIKTTSNLSKPTDEVHFYVQIYNNDSNEVWAKLKKITSPNNFSETGQPGGDAIYGDFSNGLAAWYRIYGKDPNEYCDNSSTVYASNSSVNNAGIVVKNDCHLDMIITHQWVDMDDLGMAQPEMPTGGVSLSYDLSLEFEQYVQ